MTANSTGSIDETPRTPRIGPSNGETAADMCGESPADALATVPLGNENAESMSLALASRPVSGGRPQFVAISLRMDVWSMVSLSMT